MAGLRFFAVSLILVGMLAGCFSKPRGGTPLLGEGGATPTIGIPGTDGDLFDAEADDAPACCVPGPTPPFEGPSWFLFGDPATLGPCPAPAIEGLVGYHEMKIEPHTCPACSCSSATCTFPEGVHTNAAKCADADGSLAVPYGPGPAFWAGNCTDAGALPANLQCGGVPCAQSVTVPAAGVSPCEPTSDPAAPFPEPSWARMARECVLGAPSGESCDPGQACVPEPPGGLTLCVYAQGDPPDCPPDYPERTVFYRGIDDERGCGACECSAPSGAQCTALFEMYSDAACGTLAGAVVVTDQAPACVDVVTGTALLSAEASMLVDKPGSCAPSGGAPFGALQPSDPLTLCCQSFPDPPG